MSEGKANELGFKANKFQSFLQENKIDVFQLEQLKDDFNTAIFRSRVEAKGQVMPMAILIDDSVFTIIRTQVATGIGADKKERIQDYLNRLNTEYKIFKYYLREDGSVYLDICIPFVDDSFDSKMIQLMLSVLVEHLTAVYEDFMATIWAK